MDGSECCRDNGCFSEVLVILFAVGLMQKSSIKDTEKCMWQDFFSIGR